MEYSPASEALPREIADHLARGVALFVDYGMAEGELLSSHPKGTLAAVRLTGRCPIRSSTRARRPERVRRLHPDRRAARSAGLGRWRSVPSAKRSSSGASNRSERPCAPREAGGGEVRTRLAVKNLLLGF